MRLCHRPGMSTLDERALETGVQPLDRLTPAERLNFLLTNRIPRHAVTRLVGWYSRLRSPVLARVSIAVWQWFVDDLRLEEAAEDRFDSLHACFTRRLRPDARPLDPQRDVLISPCDGVVGAHGPLRGLEALQAKGFPYRIDDLLGDPGAAETLAEGHYVTLRLKSSMYHRLHAPAAGRVDEIRYISGDTWNVNPVALKVVERLFCKNERVVFPFRLAGDGPMLYLVAVAAVLVASVRVHGLGEPLDLAYRGPNRIPLARRYRRGEELGYFEQGSTVVVLAPAGLRPCPELRTGAVIRMGQPLLIR